VDAPSFLRQPGCSGILALARQRRVNRRRAKISKTENQKATYGKVDDAQRHSTGQKGAPMTNF